MPPMYHHNEDRNFEILKRLDPKIGREAPKDVAKDYDTTPANIRQIAHRYQSWYKKVKVQGRIRYRPIAVRIKKSIVGKLASSQPVTNIALTVVN